MKRWLQTLLDVIRFRADAARRLALAERRASLAESTLRDYDQKLAQALIDRSNLQAQVDAMTLRPHRRPRSRKSVGRIDIGVTKAARTR